MTKSKRGARMAGRRGFTLIELMLVVAIVGILTLIALPSYKGYVAKANRSQAQQIVSLIANRETQYFLDARSYTANLDSTGLNMKYESWDCSTTATACANANYAVTVAVNAAGTAPGFTVTATPKATGTNKSEAAVTLAQDGTKSGPWTSS